MGGGLEVTGSLYSRGGGREDGVGGTGFECHTTKGSGWVLALTGGRCPG
jgi:hypothetical protein